MRRPRKPVHPAPAAARPESLMMSFGYQPELSEGSIKPPIFQTSTFAFRSAAEGKEYFAWAYGLEERDPARPMGLIYSRLNNPNLEILEERLNLWDRAEESAVFASGMAAISTSILATVPLGCSVVFSEPVYGGTDYLMEHVLPAMGIRTRCFHAGDDAAAAEAEIERLAAEGAPCRMVYLETPSNPTIVSTDIAAIAEVAHRHGALCAVDNTLLGPLYQQPLGLGADLVLYSATKYLGGHSDLVAGAALGSAALIHDVKMLRTILGNMLDPHSAWLLLRSLETAKLRMTCSRKNAEKIARWLASHPGIARVFYPGYHDDPRQRAIYERQCSGGGALVAFELAAGTEEAAFAFLDALHHVKLAVSLGANESLAEHPASMTHSDVPPERQREMGITPGLVRLAVGIEHPDDLIADLEQALAKVPAAEPVGAKG
ncbi:MAG TPA: aminotransferase class I/II-fold pyridoxal phosphate-dependent enzyme [Thermoanaerobaculia bacterium]|nr:aminotransferase class I/II-fold pyridoxal phosphate-dependent enzyme [Thermoanaerobaculia bacterium]